MMVWADAAFVMERRKVPRVLVVDDAPAPRERLCALLSDLDGFEVVALGTGEATPKVCARIEPAALIIDVPTHDPGGFERLPELRRLNPGCQIIVLTNHLEEEFRRQSTVAGVDYFLSKATEFERVVELVGATSERA